MYIMKKDIPIIQFDLDKNIFHCFNEKLAPMRLKKAILAPNIQNGFDKNYMINYDNIISFLSSRVLSIDRTNAKKILNAYHFTQSQSPIDKAKIAITCRAVSVEDDYWIKQENDNITWNDVNLRTNSLSEIMTQIALHGRSLTIQGKIHDPELTGRGSYAHAWIREKDGLYLYKKSTTGGHESEIEISVSTILDCMDIYHVKYYPAEHMHEKKLCKCKNMATEELSIVTAGDLYSFCNRMNHNFIDTILKIDSENVYKMCVVDYLISNSDRHDANWGFYMNNYTGSVFCCHPLFDHNNAFDPDVMYSKDGNESSVFENYSKKEIALKSMNHISLHNYVTIKPYMFLNQEMYESFMERACELGLYHFVDKKIMQYLHLQEYISYEPNVISTRTTNHTDILIQKQLSKNRGTSLNDLQEIVSQESAQQELDETTIERGLPKSHWF